MNDHFNQAVKMVKSGSNADGKKPQVQNAHEEKNASGNGGSSSDGHPVRVDENGDAIDIDE